MIGLSFRSRSGWSRQQARQYLLSTSSASNRKLPAQRLTEARASGRVSLEMLGFATHGELREQRRPMPPHGGRTACRFRLLVNTRSLLHHTKNHASQSWPVLPQEQDTTPNVNKTSTKQPNRSGGSPLNDGGGSSDDGVLTRLTQLLAEVVASPLFYLVAGLAAVKLVASTGEQSASILAFAAAPIVLLTALSKSSLGKQVQDALNERLPELEAQAAELRRAHAAARQSSRWYGARRPRLPGSLGAAPHLTGDVAGDYGFDPLGFSAEAQKFAWNYEAELLHGRWAMLGVVGCLVPEALSMRGVDVGEPVWWKVRTKSGSGTGRGGGRGKGRGRVARGAGQVAVRAVRIRVGGRCPCVLFLTMNHVYARMRLLCAAATAAGRHACPLFVSPSSYLPPASLPSSLLRPRSAPQSSRAT